MCKYIEPSYLLHSSFVLFFLDESRPISGDLFHLFIVNNLDFVIKLYFNVLSEFLHLQRDLVNLFNTLNLLNFLRLLLWFSLNYILRWLLLGLGLLLDRVNFILLFQLRQLLLFYHWNGNLHLFNLF